MVFEKFDDCNSVVYLNLILIYLCLFLLKIASTPKIAPKITERKSNEKHLIIVHLFFY